MSKKSRNEDEVEQLLQAAQDEMLLKLTLNSHTSRSSPIDSDLDRRFQALKNPAAQSLPPPPKLNHLAAEGDDLFARFAALKNSLPSHSRQTNDDQTSSSINQQEDDDDDDEIEKMIKWAIDAARLDPSPPSDDDDDENDDGTTDDDDCDDGSYTNGKNKGKCK